MSVYRTAFPALFLLCLFPGLSSAQLLGKDRFKTYVDNFVRWYAPTDNFTYAFPDAQAWSFIQGNVPFFEIDDPALEEMYYYRWFTYRKHIRAIPAPANYMVTEFGPGVGWSGAYNGISCPANLHFYEGRWIRDPKYLQGYARYWFRTPGAQPNRYSFNPADAFYAMFKVHPDTAWITDLLDPLAQNYKYWQDNFRHVNGLYWQDEWWEGMELSVSHHLGGRWAYRATINSYQFSDARAIAAIARMKNDAALAADYAQRADRIKELANAHLWDDTAKHFKGVKVGNQTDNGHPGNHPQPARMVFNATRELYGFVPWAFHMADAGKEAAWKQLMDPQGFYAPFGPTTAERRSPYFGVMWAGRPLLYPNNTSTASGCCTWDGPSWPLATSQTLIGLANLLNDYRQAVMTKHDYYRVLKNYTRGMRREGRPWVGEHYDGMTGRWIHEQDYPRGNHYNHSAYNDLLISGLIGLRPRADDTLEVNPLIPQDSTAWFMLDDVRYRGRKVAVAWDRTGARYGRGQGLTVFIDSLPVARAAGLGRIKVALDARPVAVRERGKAAKADAPRRLRGLMPAYSAGSGAGPRDAGGRTLDR